MVRTALRSLIMLRLLVPFTGGILISHVYQEISSFPVWIITISMAVLTLIFAVFSAIKNTRSRIRLNGLLIHILFFLAGVQLCVQNIDIHHDTHFSKWQHSYLICTISEVPVYKEKNTSLIARVISDEHNRSLSGKISIYIRRTQYDTSRFTMGDMLIIPAKYEEIKAPLNPGEFNYKRYQNLKNIYHSIYINPGQQYQVIRQDRWSIYNLSANLAERLISILRSALKDDGAFAITSALLLGYRSEIDKETVRHFSDTGTIHILSVSGLHVAIIYLVFDYLLSMLMKSRSLFLPRCVLIILFIWFYALLTGLSPSVARAATMISFTVTGKLFQKRSNSINILAASAFVLLMANPFFLFDYGFLLSYSAVLGILCFQKQIYNLLLFNNKLSDQLWSLCSVSIAAQLSTFPMSIYLFHQFPNYFLISNLLLIPVAGMVLYTGIFLFIVYAIPYLNTITAWILEQTINLMNYLLRTISELPLAVTTHIQLSFTGCILIYILMLIGLFRARFTNTQQVMCIQMVFILWLAIDTTKKDTSFILYHHSRLMIIEAEKGRHSSLLIAGACTTKDIQRLKQLFDNRGQYLDRIRLIPNNKEISITLDNTIFTYLPAGYKDSPLQAHTRIITPSLNTSYNRPGKDVLIYHGYTTELIHNDIVSKNLRKGTFIYSTQLSGACTLNNYFINQLN